MASKIKSYFFEILVAIFVCLFLYTAIMKLRDIELFIYTIEENKLIKPYGRMLGWAIPVVEIVISVLLAIPRTRFYGLIAATSLMAIFTIYVGYMLATFSKLPCTCGGVIDQMGWEEHLIFNGSFLVTGAIAIFLYPNSLLQTNRRSRIPVENSRRQLIN